MPPCWATANRMNHQTIDKINKIIIMLPCPLGQLPHSSNQTMIPAV